MIWPFTARSADLPPLPLIPQPQQETAMQPLALFAQALPVILKALQVIFTTLNSPEVQTDIAAIKADIDAVKQLLAAHQAPPATSI